MEKNLLIAPGISADYNINMTLTLGGISFGLNLPGSITTNNNPQMLEHDMNFDAPNVSMSLKVYVENKDDTLNLYYRIQNMEQTEWARMSLPISSLYGDYDELEEIIELDKFIALDKKDVRTITEVGEEEINGKHTVHYSIKIDMSEDVHALFVDTMNKLLTYAVEKEGDIENAPEETETDINKLSGTLIDSLSLSDADIWVSDDYRPVKMKLDFSQSVTAIYNEVAAMAEDIEEPPFDIEALVLEINFNDINSVEPIVIPPEAFAAEEVKLPE